MTETKKRGPVMILKEFFGIKPDGIYSSFRGFKKEMGELSKEERVELAELVEKEMGGKD